MVSFLLNARSERRLVPRSFSGFCKGPLWFVANYGIYADHLRRDQTISWYQGIPIATRYPRAIYIWYNMQKNLDKWLSLLEMDGEHDEHLFSPWKSRIPKCGQDGRSASLTAPNGPAQERCLQVAGGSGKSGKFFQVLSVVQAWLASICLNDSWHFNGEVDLSARFCWDQSESFSVSCTRPTYTSWEGKLQNDPTLSSYPFQHKFTKKTVNLCGNCPCLPILSPKKLPKSGESLRKPCLQLPGKGSD